MQLTTVEVLSVTFIIAGGVFYHLCQKSTPALLDPFLALFVSFGLASLTCLIIALVRHGITATQFQRLNWASAGLALSIVGIESGYLIGYRIGLKLNVTSFACNAMIALVLLGIGTFVYHESFTARNTAGFVLCVIGLILLR